MKNLTLLLFVTFTAISYSQKNFKTMDSKKNSSDEIFKDKLKEVIPQDSNLLNDFDINNIKIIKIDVAENNYKIYYADSIGGQIKIKLIPMIYGEKPLSADQFGILSLSLFTTPFKIRPKQGDVPQEFKSDLKNVGLYSSLFYIKRKTILNDGSIREHKFSTGLFVSPTSEEFNLQNTNGKIDKSNRLVISTGVAINYTYKSIVLSYIPLGYDYGTTSDKKDWIYNKKRWWGFGIGLDAKFFGL